MIYNFVERKPGEPMNKDDVQISAYISRETKELMEAYTREHGVTKAFLVESALLHHLQALRELPADVLVPARLVLTRPSGEALLESIDEPAAPTKAMRSLMSDRSKPARRRSARKRR
jgi:uncharacterized protein (DUF1778 family)